MSIVLVPCSVGLGRHEIDPKKDGDKKCNSVGGVGDVGGDVKFVVVVMIEVLKVELVKFVVVSGGMLDGRVVWCLFYFCVSFLCFDDRSLIDEESFDWPWRCGFVACDCCGSGASVSCSGVWCEVGW